MTAKTHNHEFLKMGQLTALLVLAIGVLFFLSFLSGSSPERPFISSELQFTDDSTSGLSIVPASCPSSPHYAGECGVGGSSTPNPPTVSGNACVIGVSPATIRAGQSAYLAWNSDYRIFGIPFSVTGTISPTPGNVAGSGVTTVSPSATTIYTGTFTPTGSLSGIPGSWLTSVTCSAQLTVVPAAIGPTACSVSNFCVGSDLYRQTTSCTNEYITTCEFGCSNGVCLGAPSPTGFLRVRPALVRSGETTIVEWSASQVDSCAVTGTNDDSWTGDSGAQTSGAIAGQTTFTLTCEGLDGSTLTRTAVVNVVPVFNEN